MFANDSLLQTMDNFGYVADSEDEGMQVPYQWGQKYVLIFFIPYLILEMILSVQSRIATMNHLWQQSVSHLNSKQQSLGPPASVLTVQTVIVCIAAINSKS